VITREWPLIPVYGTVAAFFVFDELLIGRLEGVTWTLFVFAWLFAIMLWSAFAVVRHSECLAAISGEPYGTLILTLAITIIEVAMIAAIMLTGPEVSMVALARA